MSNLSQPLFTGKMPPKKAVSQIAANASEEGIKLLEASKRWRNALREAERAEEPIEAVSAAVTVALDEVVTCQLSTLDKVNKAMTKSTSATKGSELATGLANKAMTLSQETHKAIMEHQEATTKQMKELSLQTKNALSHIQRLELANSETSILCKGILCLTEGKESMDDMKRSMRQVFSRLGVEGVQVEHARRMQRVKGDRGRGPAALKIRVGSVAEKLRIYDALKRATSGGADVPFEFQNEVPSYALSTHKNLHKLAQEIRRIDSNIKTRVSMGKGDHWPTLRIKRRGEALYHTAATDLLELAKANIHKANKAQAAARKVAQDNRLLYGNEEHMDTNSQASTSAGPAAAAGKIDNNNFNICNTQ